MTFNPSAPNTIGLEWPAISEGYTVIDAATKVAAARIKSTADETIDHLILPHRWSGPKSGYGRLWTDVYDMSATPVADNVTELTFTPNEDRAKSSNLRKSDWASTTNLWQVINSTDDSGPPEWTDYLINTNVGGVAHGQWQFNTAGISNTYRILYVKFEVRAKGFDWSWQQPFVDIEWYNGTTYLGRIGRVFPPQDYRWRTYSYGPFYFDPYNEGAWLQPEIALLDSTSARNVGLHLHYAVAVSRFTMKVGVIPENRVAVGISPKQTVPPQGLQTNLPIHFKSPLNSDNWSKQNGKTYMLVTRRLEDPFAALPSLTVQVANLDSGRPNPHEQGDAYSLELADLGGRITSYSGPQTLSYAPVLGTTGGATSVDSQPYHDLVAHSVHNGQTVRQGVAGATVQDYKRVHAFVATAAPPTAPLAFTVHQLSDNAQVGGTGTLSPSDLSDASIAQPRGTIDYSGVTFTIYEVVVQLSSAAVLAPSTDYYIQLASTTGSATPWLALALDSQASHSLTGNRTYGGSAQQLYVAGSPNASADALVTISAVPSQIGGFIGSLLSRDLPNNGGSQCDPGTMHYVHLNWTSTALGSAFVRYEVARSVDGGQTWTTIAHITDESTSNFDDYEAPRNVASTYRVRVMRSDGATSDWTVLADSLTPPGSPGVLLFVTNSNPALSTGYVQLGATSEYEFLSAGETVFMRLHNRDYQAAFRPLEDRGIRWPFSVMVYVDDPLDDKDGPPGGTGIRAFDDLRAIAQADVPYVCVLTPDGETLYGTIQVPNGARTEPAQYYVASCIFTQTQDSPSIVTV